MYFEHLLLYGAGFAGLLWGVLSLYVVHVDRRRRQSRGVVAAVLSALGAEDVRGLPLEQRLARVTPLLDRISRDMVLYVAADDATPRDAFELICSYLQQRWGGHILMREASSHRLARDVWRRTASLKVLFDLDHPAALDLLARAAAEHDADVASAAFALLGTSRDPRAVKILIEALKEGRHPASRVAMHLERSEQRPAEAYRDLLSDPNPTVRFWGATLLGDYPELEWVERELVPLAADADPRVRKAAIQALGRAGGDLAANAARAHLGDPEPFVRAHAARALAQLDRIDDAALIGDLLGDCNAWVRAAAKESLESLGAEVWPVLVRLLDSPDGFARNGAAEVIQNLGLLDNLIVMEAASDAPSPAKIRLLRRIVEAGGARLTESLLDRVGAAHASRVRELLATLRLEQVGTC